MLALSSMELRKEAYLTKYGWKNAASLGCEPAILQSI
jgi:hypothetical protein